MPLRYVSSCFQNYPFVSIFQQYNYNVHRLDTILFYQFWSHWDFWICKLQPSQNLGNYWSLFLQILFCTIPSSLLGLQIPQSLEFLILSLISLYIYLVLKNICASFIHIRWFPSIYLQVQRFFYYLHSVFELILWIFYFNYCTF